ncbi:protein-tyrosine-phosphatase [Cyclobacterium jeungdonense]|uniref:Protein-tyrosine-phosphatase n=1 Tax=Cyclobacterium jeungdonense TaxID=708087 RepID=A0ABT8CEV4_9BACT|nr:protein-tyrosine-phosphatase [Cyclobacterium jeungdonense]MDN3690255.1 protein-tyrosine-phosphatase [Cyclobacterium jeungdonense]
MKRLLIPFSIVSILFLSCTSNSKKEGNPNAKVSEPIQATMSSEPKTIEISMYPELSQYIESVLAGIDAIPNDRKDQLKKIALYVQTKKKSNEPANLTFICTHNSRRSHLSQIWAATAAAYYGVEEGVHTYSGGTEATAFNPRAVAAIERAGFRVNHTKGDNPRYKVSFSENGEEVECFSKKYDDAFNASENFAAIMTCSEADKSCPFIPGASLRVPIPYVDPKEADGTEQEAAVYDERTKQIATEMFYMMSQVKV